MNKFLTEQMQQAWKYWRNIKDEQGQQVGIEFEAGFQAAVLILRPAVLDSVSLINAASQACLILDAKIAGENCEQQMKMLENILKP